MNQVGLFAKFWQPGRVKTRLAADLGEKSACEIYQFFLSHLIHRLCRTGDLRTIVYSPADRKQEFRSAAGDGWQTIPQADGNLGQRMKQFFQHSLQVSKNGQVSDDSKQILVHHETLDQDEAIRKTVVIGSDCPQLTPSDIQQAFEQLDTNEVVLGPSDDGGYYLIGMRNECFEVFDDIDWSTPQVLQQTRDRLKSLGVAWSELGHKSDIDDLTGLLKFHSAAKETSDPGDPDFVLLGAIEGVLAEYRQRGGRP